MSRPPARSSMAARARFACDAAGRSHRGLVRAANEDAWIARPGRGMFAVVDGMGGARAGARAAALTREAIDQAPVRTSAELRAAFERAHEAIRAHAAAHPEDEGLGCVASAALVRGSRLTVAHVGDTRAYLATGAGCERLTRDHTVVAELEERHVMTEQAAGTLPGRHRVTRDLGSGARAGSAWVDLGESEIGPGDLLLLATDGLTDMVDDGEIARLLGDARRDPDADLERLAERLVELTLERGAPDNVTVVVVRRPTGAVDDDTDTIRLPGPVRRPRATTPTAPPRPRRRHAVVLGMVGLVLGAALGWLLGRWPDLLPSAGALRVAAGPATAEGVAEAIAGDAAGDLLAGGFAGDAMLTVLGPATVPSDALDTTVAASTRVDLHGLELRFLPASAAWTLRLGAVAELTLRQALLRAPGLRLEARLEAGARLTIADSHVELAALDVHGPADATVRIDGGRFLAAATPTTSGPTILVDGVEVGVPAPAEPSEPPPSAPDSDAGDGAGSDEREARDDETGDEAGNEAGSGTAS